MLSLNTWDVAVALTNYDWAIFDSVHEVRPAHTVRLSEHMSSKWNFDFECVAALGAARTRILHLQPRQEQWPHGGAGAVAAALQRGAAVGDDRGAALLVSLQEGATHQEVHQDRRAVSSFAPQSAHLTVAGAPSSGETATLHSTCA